MKLSLTCIVLVLLGGGSARADCKENVRAATPTARFIVHSDGTATDRRTGLTWMRCPFGTVLDDAGTPAALDDDHCRPGPFDTPTYSWGQALTAAADLDAGGGFAGSTSWRVPSWKELVSIVETRCSSPAINGQVFPDTLGSFFTSTPNTSVRMSVWAVEFQSGLVLGLPKTGSAHLRLVH